MDKKVLLAIPSKARVSTLSRFTLQWLKLMPFDWMIFVEPQDMNSYLLEVDGKNLFNIGENNRGLGFAKQAIKNYAKNFQYDFIFKIDDDIRCFTDFRRKQTFEGTARTLTSIIKLFIQTAEAHDTVKAFSFPYSHELWEQTGWENSKRLQTCYFVRTEDFFIDPRINVFEDFAAGLHIIANGGRILRYGLSGIDCGVKVGGGTGGHQSYDRKAQAEQEMKPLLEIYPDLKFRKVKKPWGLEPDLKSIKSL